MFLVCFLSLEESVLYSHLYKPESYFTVAVDYFPPQRSIRGKWTWQRLISRVWSSVKAEIRRCETAIFLVKDCKESITFWASFSGEEGEKP